MDAVAVMTADERQPVKRERACRILTQSLALHEQKVMLELVGIHTRKNDLE
jgi:hypothetical protein